MERTNYSSGAKWEDIVGYSRAVKVGNTIEVTGTVAVNDENVLVGGDSAYQQTKFGSVSIWSSIIWRIILTCLRHITSAFR
jgi:hypothetical protein